MADIQKVAAGLSKIAGKKNVITDRAAMKKLVKKYRGFAKPEVPVGMVYVQTTEEIKAVIDFVREETDCGIVACSSEDTIKMTEASLPAEGTESIILNLSRMKRIFRIDERNRVAFVEAGVTFAELEEALKGTELKLDTPFQARPGQSVVATMLDRDPITVPMNVWDTNDPLLCLEVVFGDGTIFRTGSAAGPGTLEEQWAAGVAMNNSMGPSHTDFARVLSGSQGTLGIVAWASIKLELKPTIEKMLYVESENVEKAAPVIWKGVRRRLGNNYLMLNDFALASVIGQDAQEIEEIAESAAPWTTVIDMVGKRMRPEQKVEYQTKDLIHIAKGDPIRMKITDSIKAAGNLQMKKIVSGLSEGKLWKHRYSGNAIDLFFLTTLDQADRFVETAKSTIGADAKLGVYIQPAMQARYCHMEMVIPFAEEEREAAKELYVKLSEALLEAGAFFSRPYGICKEQIFARSPMQVKTIEKCKKLFDEKHVLNPDRFFREVAE